MNFTSGTRVQWVNRSGHINPYWAEDGDLGTVLYVQRYVRGDIDVYVRWDKDPNNVRVCGSKWLKQVQEEENEEEENEKVPFVVALPEHNDKYNWYYLHQQECPCVRETSLKGWRLFEFDSCGDAVLDFIEYDPVNKKLLRTCTRRIEKSSYTHQAN